jgi:hypothetical protein
MALTEDGGAFTANVGGNFVWEMILEAIFELRHLLFSDKADMLPSGYLT